MSTGVSEPIVPDRTEDFPVDSFRYMESKLRRFRRLVMDVAAKSAAEHSGGAIYHVERKHVDDALATLLDPEIANHELGARRLDSRTNDNDLQVNRPR